MSTLCPQDYWASFEHPVDSFGSYIEAVRTISAYQAATGARFVWRGVADSRWALHSSLVRWYEELNGGLPTEDELARVEREIVEEARDWSLDWHSGGGRLTGLEMLAALQHYGAKTRLLDFTFNPLIALWFALEKDDSVDGRVFAVDTRDRIVAGGRAASRDPWWFEQPPHDWVTRSWVWRPPPFESRIVRQDGCFLMGGIPVRAPARNVRRSSGGWRFLDLKEVRRCMSVPFSLIQYKQAQAADEGRRLRGRQPTTCAFTLRITHKSELRADLDRTFGYTYATMYPDFAGFAAYGGRLPAGVVVP